MAKPHRKEVVRHAGRLVQTHRSQQRGLVPTPEEMRLVRVLYANSLTLSQQVRHVEQVRQQRHQTSQRQCFHYGKGLRC